MNQTLQIGTACLLSLFASTSLEAATVEIPTAADAIIDLSNATVSGLKVESGNANIGSTGTNKWMTLTLNNTKQQDYLLQFYSGAKNCSGNWTLTLTNAQAQEVWSASTLVPQSSTSNWNRTNLHLLEVPNLPAGTYTFKALCTSTTGNYGGNLGEFAFYTPSEDIVESIPGTLDLAKGTYVSARTENNNTNVGYVSNGASATYNFYCPENGYYNMTLDVFHYSDGTIDISIANAGTKEVEQTSVFTITTSMTNYNTQSVLSNVYLTKGYKSMKMLFNTTEDFLINYKNICWTAVPTEASSVKSVTIDGLAADATFVTALNQDPHTATMQSTLTSLPTVNMEMTDGQILKADVTLSDTTAICKVKSGSGDKAITYTLNIEGVHIYQASDKDASHSFVPGSGTRENGIWSDGSVTIDNNIDPSWAFKLSRKTYNFGFPGNWIVKQITLKGCGENYDAATPGIVSKVESNGATAYVPANNTFIKGDEKDIIINFENHQKGEPIAMTIANGSQPFIRSVEVIYEEVKVTTAPSLTAHSVSATLGKNHAVATLNFSHAVAKATALCNGVNIEGRGAGNTRITFSLWDLDYDKEYELTLPAGSLEDIYGNKNTEPISVTFTTGSKQLVCLYNYDYVVGTVQELRDAIAAANAASTRTVIFIKNGDYDLGTEELSIKGSNIYLMGEDRDKVLLHGLRDGISNPVVSMRYSKDCYAENLTIRNDYNWAAENKGGVGVAFYGGTRTICYHVTLQSNQDTYVSNISAYFLECDIHGTVDFICGGGDNYFDHCNIILEDRDANCIVAPNTGASTEWGYVFNYCTVKAAAGATQVTDKSFTLGRPWQNAPRTCYLNTKFEVLPSDAGWAGMSSNLETHFYEYGSTDKNGNLLDLSTRNVKACNSSNGNYSPVLTAEEAAQYTIYNVLGGADSWYPIDAFDNHAESGESIVVKANGLATFSSSCAVEIPENIEAYYVASIDGEEACVTRLENCIPANFGVILRNTSSSDQTCIFTTTDNATQVLGNQLVATGCQGASVNAGDFVLAHPAGAELGLYPLAQDGVLAAHKAYIPQATASTIKKIALRFNNTTGIENCQAEDASNKTVYNLQGIKLATPVKGLNIVGGKKVMK